VAAACFDVDDGQDDRHGWTRKSVSSRVVTTFGAGGGCWGWVAEDYHSARLLFKISDPGRHLTWIVDNLFDFLNLSTLLNHFFALIAYITSKMGLSERKVKRESQRRCTANIRAYRARPA
jgi:hypothetical protein